MSTDLGLDLSLKNDHVLLPVLAQPRARKNAITGTHDGALRVATTQPADAGRANAAIQKLLAAALGRPPRDVTLVRGATSRRKVFRVDHCTVAQVEDLLREHL